MRRLRAHIKTITLIALILMTLVLVTQIWFGNYFSPYDFGEILADIKQAVTAPVFWAQEQAPQRELSERVTAMLQPEKIVVNHSGRRNAYYSGNPGYDAVAGLASSFMSSFFMNEYQVQLKEIADEEAYISALKGKSIYVDYGGDYDSELLSMSLCGQEGTFFSEEVSSMGEYIISFNDSVLDTVSIFCKCEAENVITRFVLVCDHAEMEQELSAVLEQQEAPSSLSYSFELNFHKEVDGAGAEPKVIFDPLVLLDVMPSTGQAISGQNLLLADNEEETQAIENAILSAFRINAKSVGQYIDFSNTKVFVENNSTLLISPNGIIEYRAIEGGAGLDIRENLPEEDNSIYPSVQAAVEFLSGICNIFSEDMAQNMRLSSCRLDSSGEDQGSYIMHFDYYFAGMPVLQRNEETGEVEHAVSIQMNNGKLEYYRQYVREYSLQESEVYVRPALRAVDTLVAQTDTAQLPLYIYDVQACYLDEAEGTKPRLMWDIMANSGRTFLPAEEGGTA